MLPDLDIIGHGPKARPIYTGPGSASIIIPAISTDAGLTQSMPIISMKIVR